MYKQSYKIAMYIYFLFLFSIPVHGMEKNKYVLNPEDKKFKPLIENLDSFHDACEKGIKENLDAHLQKTIHFVINTQDKNGLAPIHKAAVGGHHEVLQFLINLGAGVNDVGAQGETPLGLAIWSRDLATVKLLLDKGADINLPNKIGWRPLHTAIYIKDLEIIKYLKKRGAKIRSFYSFQYDSIALAHLLYTKKLEKQGITLQEFPKIIKETHKPFLGVASSVLAQLMKAPYDLIKYIQDWEHDDAIKKRRRSFSSPPDVLELLNPKVDKKIQRKQIKKVHALNAARKTGSFPEFHNDERRVDTKQEQNALLVQALEEETLELRERSFSYPLSSKQRLRRILSVANFEHKIEPDYTDVPEHENTALLLLNRKGRSNKVKRTGSLAKMFGKNQNYEQLDDVKRELEKSQNRNDNARKINRFKKEKKDRKKK